MCPERVGRERESIIVQTLAAQSRLGLGRTGQGALGLGCAILSLTLQNSKVIPYETLQGNQKLNDTYADDLTLYLKYFPLERHNKKNIKRALDCFDIFSEWSGLNINKNKTYVQFLGKRCQNLHL